MNRHVTIIITIFFIPLFAKAQTYCEVKIDKISDIYEGECKKGKAHGVGVAKGIDMYSGVFAKGYPHGEGTYNWENGNVYKGAWEQGLEDGKGVLTIKRLYKEDSILSGYWKKGIYLGQYEQPYKKGLVRNIPRNRVVKTSENGSRIFFSVKQNGLDIVIPNFVAISSNGGQYIDTGGNRKGFADFEFPSEFRVTFSVPNSFGGNSVIS